MTHYSASFTHKNRELTHKMKNCASMWRTCRAMHWESHYRLGNASGDSKALVADDVKIPDDLGCFPLDTSAIKSCLSFTILFAWSKWALIFLSVSLCSSTLLTSFSSCTCTSSSASATWSLPSFSSTFTSLPSSSSSSACSLTWNWSRAQFCPELVPRIFPRMLRSDQRLSAVISQKLT